MTFRSNFSSIVSSVLGKYESTFIPHRETKAQSANYPQQWNHYLDPTLLLSSCGFEQVNSPSDLSGFAIMPAEGLFISQLNRS